MPKKVNPRRLSKQTRTLLIAMSLVVVLLVGGLIWVIKQSQTPQNVFTAAINNSFSTSAVTIQSTQTSSADKEQQLIQLDLGQSPKILTLTTLSSSSGQVRTEDLDTPSAEYTRYVSLETNRKTKSGKPVDFSSVIGVWSKTPNEQPTASPLPANIGQILLGMSLPFGNFSTTQRAQLVNQIQNYQVYNTSFSNVQKTSVNGQPAYKYLVTVEPLLYIRFLKTYADDMGLHQLDQVNPNTYGGQPALTVTWFINRQTKRLVETQYGSNHVEQYTGYGVPVSIAVPSKTVTATYLQKRLSALLSQ
jgi:hypothetical protein